MYYYVDENGNLQASGTNEVLPEEYQEVFPESPPPQMGDDYSVGDDGVGLDDETDSEFDASVSGSGNSFVIQTPDGSVVTHENGDAFIVTPDIDYHALADAIAESISYDDLVDVLANVPSYSVFPNTSAVSVMQDVLNGIDGHFGYFVVSGSTSTEVDLYYAKKYDVVGRTITLYAPVTHCKYFQYRPTASSSYLYTFSVSDSGDTSVTLMEQLAYTNLIDGYPDLIPYKQRNLYDYNFMIVMCIIIVMLMMFSSRFRAKRGKE